MPNTIDCVDMNILRPLLEEVKEVFFSENYLRGADQPKEILIQVDKGGDYIRTWRCRISDLDHYFYSMSTKNDVTPYTILMDEVLSRMSTFANTLGNSTPKSLDDYEDRFQSEIVNFTDKSDKTIELINEITQKGGIPMESDNYYSLGRSIINAISNHGACIVQARVLTLSKRFVPTELLLEAYRAGLFPYGWSYQENVLFCLNPRHF